MTQRPYEITYVFKATFPHLSRRNARRFAAIEATMRSYPPTSDLIADGHHLNDALTCLEALAALTRRIAATQPRDDA